MKKKSANYSFLLNLAITDILVITTHLPFQVSFLCCSLRKTGIQQHFVMLESLPAQTNRLAICLLRKTHGVATESSET